MYQSITDENPYEVPMRIYPAIHYTMGGLWVDYNLMSTIPGLHVLGEANFSDHGANRLGASALMQGLADGYFVIPYTIGDYLASNTFRKITTDAPEFVAIEAEVKAKTESLIQLGTPSKAGQSKKTVNEFYHELGNLMWEDVGMARSKEGLEQVIKKIAQLREEFWQGANILGSADTLSKNLEVAGRLADFFEMGELMARDALYRTESCGAHFRLESQTPEGEALRKDDEFSYVAAWEFKGTGKEPVLHKEPLEFENIHLSQRSYK
jgi:succinate dehydrogenase / fumarate reductase flavoprotein subunit